MSSIDDLTAATSTASLASPAVAVTAPGPTLDLDLAAAIQRVASVHRLLVALDFDGTLAPEVDQPENARALPDSHLAMVKLSKMKRTRVALISGRSLDSLQFVAQPPKRVLLVGSHGVEFSLDGKDRPEIDLTTTEIRQVGALGAMLESVAESEDRVWVELKPAGGVLHTRLASATAERSVQHQMQSQLYDEFGGLTVRKGKNVLEFSVRSSDKGEALENLRAYAKADAVVYMGDDITDEDAFAVLRPDDLGIHVGGGSTKARFRVGTPEDVANVLVALRRARATAVKPAD